MLKQVLKEISQQLKDLSLRSPSPGTGEALGPSVQAEPTKGNPFRSDWNPELPPPPVPLLPPAPPLQLPPAAPLPSHLLNPVLPPAGETHPGERWSLSRCAGGGTNHHVCCSVPGGDTSGRGVEMGGI